MRHSNFWQTIVPAKSSDYAWCDGYAVVSPRALAKATKHAPPESLAQLLGRGWITNFGVADCYYRYVGSGCLYIVKHAHGWVIELTERGTRPRVLTSNLGDLVVACPSCSTAAQFAEANYPNLNNQCPIFWHSYW